MSRKHHLHSLRGWESTDGQAPVTSECQDRETFIAAIGAEIEEAMAVARDTWTRLCWGPEDGATITRGISAAGSNDGRQRK